MARKVDMVPLFLALFDSNLFSQSNSAKKRGRSGYESNMGHIYKQIIVYIPTSECITCFDLVGGVYMCLIIGCG